MSASRFRASINGFWCHNESWDDAFNWDGKHDEVFIDVNTKVVDASGSVLQNFDSESELMGDTWRLPNRVQAGSASDRGGIVSGDRFPPSPTPWLRSGSLNARRFPPYAIWEGDLRPGQDMILLTPTIWEWDPGAGFWDGWLDWQVQVDAKYGQRAKEIFGNIWPVSTPVFDAVSLGIQTVGSMAGIWSPFGKSMRRPIGTRRSPDGPDGTLFNPITIALNSETAEYLVANNLQGYGNGIVELRYADDPYLRGVYSLFLQIEKIRDGSDGTGGISGWRDVDRADRVVSMAAADGRLFAVTADKRLLIRDSVERESNWTHIGSAVGDAGLAATGGRLFCATRENELWTRQASPIDMEWTRIGHANGVVGLTALNGSLFCATGNNRLWTRAPILSDVDWKDIGHANGVLCLGSSLSDLHCVTSDGRLWRRPPNMTDTPWTEVGPAPTTHALAGTSRGLFATTEEDRLLFKLIPPPGF
ncbi:hypothetical protein [Streptomyces sp. NPDC057690]|uniref:hypothetical protein n=1 Tax=Streptomyces sp. NPDC057690 TaxID=3346214 RepID=UPI00367C734A